MLLLRNQVRTKQLKLSTSEMGDDARNEVRGALQHQIASTSKNRARGATTAAKRSSRRRRSARVPAHKDAGGERRVVEFRQPRNDLRTQVGDHKPSNLRGAAQVAANGAIVIVVPGAADRRSERAVRPSCRGRVNLTFVNASFVNSRRAACGMPARTAGVRGPANASERIVRRRDLGEPGLMTIRPMRRQAMQRVRAKGGDERRPEGQPSSDGLQGTHGQPSRVGGERPVCRNQTASAIAAHMRHETHLQFDCTTRVIIAACSSASSASRAKLKK